MLSLEKTLTKESTTPGFEGVKYTIRRLNRVQRSKMDLAVLKERYRLTEAAREYNALHNDKSELIDESPESRERAGLLDAEIGSLLSGYLKPAMIRAALVKIEGIEVEGKPATADALLEAGNTGTLDVDALIDEIWTEAEVAARLSPAQQKNSQSPTTSADQESGGENSSTAAVAEVAPPVPTVA